MEMNPLFEPYMVNAQSAKVYFSELDISTYELKDSWQQIFWKT